MRCNNCGMENGNNMKFCQSCGMELKAKNKQFVQMICPNCGYSLESDSMFCRKCGCTVKNIVEEKRICPICYRELSQDATFCGVCGTPVESVPVRRNRATTSKKGNVLIGVIISLSFILMVGIGTILVVYNLNKEETPNVPVASNEASLPTEPAEVMKDDVEEEKVEKDNDGDEFSYQFNQKNVVTNPSYIEGENLEYSYHYAIPEHFIKGEDGKYYAPDNTAVMDFYASSNDSNLSVNSALDNYISEIGGNVTYSATGDTWFAVSIRKDGIAYYRKGFVDHHLRYFSFSFPEEYIDIYDDYIEYIEDRFKRADV